MERFSISSMLFHPVGGSLWDVHTSAPTECPTVAPWVAISTSVTVPPLASDSKSVPLSSSASGNTTQSHGPSILGPPFGNAGLSNQMSFMFSRNPSKGEKLEISLCERSSHVKLVNSQGGICPISRCFQDSNELTRLTRKGRYIRYSVGGKIQFFQAG